MPIPPPTTTPIAIARQPTPAVVTRTLNQRDDHADHRETVAAARGRGEFKYVQAEDEQSDRDEVDQRDRDRHRLVHFAPLLAAEHLQHSFGDREAAEDVDGSERDRGDREHRHQRCRSSRPRRAGDARRSRRPARCRGSRWSPTSSGVCSVVGTFEITSKPTKTARTRTVSSADVDRRVSRHAALPPVERSCPSRTTTGALGDLVVHDRRSKRPSLIHGESSA